MKLPGNFSVTPSKTQEKLIILMGNLPNTMQSLSLLNSPKVLCHKIGIGKKKKKKETLILSVC